MAMGDRFVRHTSNVIPTAYLRREAIRGHHWPSGWQSLGPRHPNNDLAPKAYPSVTAEYSPPLMMMGSAYPGV